MAELPSHNKQLHIDRSAQEKRQERYVLPRNATISKELAEDIKKKLLSECRVIVRKVCEAAGVQEIFMHGPKLLDYFDRHSLEEYDLRIDDLLNVLLENQRCYRVYSDGTVVMDHDCSKEIFERLRECIDTRYVKELDILEKQFSDIEFSLKEPIAQYVPTSVLGIVKKYSHISHPADMPNENGTTTIYIHEPTLNEAYGYKTDVRKVREEIKKSFQENAI